LKYPATRAAPHDVIPTEGAKRRSGGICVNPHYLGGGAFK
jgi:hypothetical protein